MHPYTFRVENNFLPTNLRSSANLAESGNLFAEPAAYFAAGVDRVFTDIEIGIGIVSRLDARIVAEIQK